MRTTAIIIGFLLLSASAARAQYPYGGGYGGYQGGYGGSAGNYRGPGATLSPYLNLLNSGNPATNYYNFVRPGMYNPNRFGPNAPTGPGFGRSSFFPTLQHLDEEDLPGQKNLPKKNEKDDTEPVRVQLPPTGHGVGFTNSLGYFGPMMATQGGIGSAGRGATGGRRR